MEYLLPVGVLESLHFAAEIHLEQRKKNYEQMPYINHIISVVKLLAECGETEIKILHAAALHDSIEDEKTTFEAISKKFGEQAADIVLELSDDMSLNYEIRKEKQLEGCTSLSREAKVIRLADKICNIRDFISYPIKKTPEEMELYCNWSQRIYEKINGINIKLDNEFSEVISDYREYAKKKLKVNLDKI